MASSQQIFSFLGENMIARQEEEAIQNNQQHATTEQHQQQQSVAPAANGASGRRRRRDSGTPREGRKAEVEVISLSPEDLTSTDRFRRNHTEPRRRPEDGPPKRKVYICPEAGCVHNEAARALGDLTGIKKHFSRKHVAAKDHTCEHCSRAYAVFADLKAHRKNCPTRTFNKKDQPMLPLPTFMTHPPYVTMPSSSTSNSIQSKDDINNVKSREREALQEDLQGQMPMDINDLVAMNSPTHGFSDDRNKSISNGASCHGLCTEDSEIIFNGGTDRTCMRDNGGGVSLFQSTGQNEGLRLQQAKEYEGNFNSSNVLQRTQASTPSTSLRSSDRSVVSATALFEKAAKIASSLGNKSFSLLDPYNGGRSSVSNSTFVEPNQSNYIQQPVNPYNGSEGSSLNTTLFGSNLNSNLGGTSSFPYLGSTLSSSSKMKLPPPVLAPSIIVEPNQINHTQQPLNCFNGGEGSSSNTNLFGSLLGSNRGGTSYPFSLPSQNIMQSPPSSMFGGEGSSFDTNLFGSLLGSNRGGSYPICLASQNIMPSPPSSMFDEPNQRNCIQRPVNLSNGGEGSSQTSSLIGFNISPGKNSAVDGLTRDFLGVGNSVNEKR